MSILLSAVRSDADASAPDSFPPRTGPFPPALEVEKNCGSQQAKSFSSSIRLRRTDPTIPRQPISPTFFTVLRFFYVRASPLQF